MVYYLDMYVKRLKDLFRGTTMYRSMLYYLLFLIVAAVGLAFFGKLPYDPFEIVFEAIYLIVVCYLSNLVFAKLFKLIPNPESQVITALILALIIGPLPVIPNLLFLTLAGFLSQASKYIFAYRQRHFFNPAAFGVFATAILISHGASWWVGNIWLFPAVVAGGLIMAQKILRWHLIASFIASFFVLLFIMNPGADFVGVAKATLLYSPILFFSFVMLVEPLTSPQDRNTRIYYGILIAILYSLLAKFFPTVPYGLELSLLVGNLFARLSKLDAKLALTLVKKEVAGKNILNFWFQPVGKVNFKPGQYFEWTLPHPNPDRRGIRRFFTIASAPTENRLLLTTKFTDERPSSFKQRLRNLKEGEAIYAQSLQGEFTLPSDRDRKLVFIAGGIGITPFRSMLKYMTDTHKCYDAVLLYGVNSEDEIVHRNVFEKAATDCGLKPVYVIKERIDENLIKRDVPDWRERLFYVSGPQGMVKAFEEMLADMGVHISHIKHDYFPGYA